MLCSLASPCSAIWVSKGGQYNTWQRHHVLPGRRTSLHNPAALSRRPRRLGCTETRFENLSDGYHHALDDFCTPHTSRSPAENGVQRLFARMAADRDISAQEAVHQLLGCSPTFVNLNADVDVRRLFRHLRESERRRRRHPRSRHPSSRATKHAQPLGMCMYASRK